jgi:TIR domain
MARRVNKKRLVFVSHSARDTWVARQIAREIGQCGAEPFLDEAQIEVGEDFEEEILGFLAKADELVVLMTPWALERPYVWAELGAAWLRRIPIVILLQGMTPAELQSRPGIPVFLKSRNMVDLNAIDGYLGELRKRVRP